MSKRFLAVKAGRSVRYSVRSPAPEALAVSLLYPAFSFRMVVT